MSTSSPDSPHLTRAERVLHAFLHTVLTRQDRLCDARTQGQVGQERCQPAQVGFPLRSHSLSRRAHARVLLQTRTPCSTHRAECRQQWVARPASTKPVRQTDGQPSAVKFTRVFTSHSGAHAVALTRPYASPLSETQQPDVPLPQSTAKRTSLAATSTTNSRTLSQRPSPRPSSARTTSPRQRPPRRSRSRSVPCPTRMRPPRSRARRSSTPRAGGATRSS